MTSNIDGYVAFIGVVFSLLIIWTGRKTVKEKTTMTKFGTFNGRIAQIIGYLEIFGGIGLASWTLYNIFRFR